MYTIDELRQMSRDKLVAEYAKLQTAQGLLNELTANIKKHNWSSILWINEKHMVATGDPVKIMNACFYLINEAAESRGMKLDTVLAEALSNLRSGKEELQDYVKSDDKG